MYFCCMKYCWILLGMLFLGACKNKGNQSKGIQQETLSPQVEQLANAVTKHPDSVGLRLQLVDALDSMGKLSLAMVQMDSLIKKDKW